MAPQTNKQRKEGRTTTTKQQKKEQMKCTILPKQTIILQDIQNPAHLTEYQHPRAILLHRRKELVQDDHLARVLVAGRLGLSARQFGESECLGT